MANTSAKLDDSNRQVLERMAYRMLGTWADAEDLAQEALLRWHALDEESRASINEPLAWLHKVTTRLCLDYLKSARKRRECYVGPWLPEPILTDESDPADAAEIDDSIHLALMLALERLSPSERAAFLLHDIFGYGYGEIASILDKSNTASRQLASRARSAIQVERQKFDFDPAAHQRLLEAFLHAAKRGDTESLANLLAEDVVAHSDGGGLARAARKVLESRDIVARFFLGLARKQSKSSTPPPEVRFCSINGLPSILFVTEGILDTVMSISVANGRIQSVYQQRNPLKLKTLAHKLGLAAPPSYSANARS